MPTLNDFAHKLQTLMNLSGYRPTDVVNHSKLYQNEFNTKITKQDMSNYLSGRSKPLNRKLELLCKTLNVNSNYFTSEVANKYADDFSNEEITLVNCWRSATPKDKDMIAYILRDYGFVYEKESKIVV